MDIRSFFYSWCAERNIVALVNVRETNIQQRRRFLCEIQVRNCPYTGWGSSADSVEAEVKAVEDFVNYFIQQNVINPSEIANPANPEGGRIGEDFPVRNPPGGRATPSGEVNGAMDPPAEASRPHEDNGNDSVPTCNEGVREVYKLQEKAGDSKQDDHFDGNWTVENAKCKLHQYMQQHNIKGDYDYTVNETEGRKNFVAELSIHVKELNRTLTGRESGPSKLIASKNCALSIIRQLYHLGVIDAFTGSLRLNKGKKTELAPYEVYTSPELEDQILDVLRDLNIKPIRVDPKLESEEPVSIVKNTLDNTFIPRMPFVAEIIAWSSPTTNWNPWLSCNINEAPLSALSLDEISKIVEYEFRERLQRGEVHQKIITERGHLPIENYKNEIMNMIHENSVCIIRGNTGCGKTTQVAQFILNDYILTGQGAYCNIIVTQPKKISAISIADRVAYERGETLGMSVGYSVPFETAYPRPYGSILFCTVRSFVKKLELGLKGISHIIVDEIHERDMYTDFILVILRDMVNTYPDLRLVLMSATMDTALFSNYFSGCPVFEIPGQLFPVKEYFLEDTIELLKFSPLGERKKRNKKRKSRRNYFDEEDFVAGDVEENLNLKINPEYSPDTKYALSLLDEKEISFKLIREILRYIRNLEQKGAVLIFLPGWSVIFSLIRHLQQWPDFAGQDYVLLPLHGRLSQEEQKRVFEEFPPNVTKVILSTNIAESSVTINDVVYVIDSCKIKTKTFAPGGNLTQYATAWASRTNIEQRRGRAGRVRPGICFHLCSKARYEALEKYTVPEIFRSPLHDLVLAIKILRQGEIGTFLSRAPEPPSVDAVIEAVIYLREMKYIDFNDILTPLGGIIGRLPVASRLGRMLILGVLFNCTNALATVVAHSTTGPGLFLNRTGNREPNLTQKAFSGGRYSDHIAIINAFQTWERANRNRTNVKLCSSKMLSETSLKLTADAKYQLLSLLENCCGFPREKLMDQVFNYHGPDPNLDMVTALLPVGFYPNIAFLNSRRKLLTTGNKIALINKRSVNCSNENQTFPYPFFVYEEKVKTKVVTCKQMTMVTPLSLLLFGARKVEYVKGLIKLDGWINLKMNPFVASSIVALRPALENLIIKAANEPSQIMNLSPTEEKVLRVVRELCKISVGRYETEELHSHTLQLPTQSQDVRGGDDPGNGAENQSIGFDLNGRSLEPNSENSREVTPRNQGELMNPGEPRNQGDDKGLGNPRDLRGNRQRKRRRATAGYRGSRGYKNMGKPWNFRGNRGRKRRRETVDSSGSRDDLEDRDQNNPMNAKYPKYSRIHSENASSPRNSMNPIDFTQSEDPVDGGANLQN